MFIEGSDDGELNGIFPVRVVPPPSSGVRRLVRALTIANPMSTGVALSVAFVSGVKRRFLFSGVLQRRETWSWGYQGVLVLDSPAKYVEAWMETAPAIQPTFVSGWGDAS